MTTDLQLLSGYDDESIVKFLTEASEVDERSADQVAADIMARLLSATSADEVLARNTTTHARDYLDQTFVLRGYKFQRSDFPGGSGVYMVLDCVNVEGEPFTLTCGARNVMVQAFKLRQFDALPAKVAVVQTGRPTANGYFPMQLVKAEESF